MEAAVAVIVDEVCRRIAQRSAHGLRHVGAGLKAAAGDARDDGAVQVGGIGAVDLGHSPGGLGGNAQRRAPPSGVAGADDLLHRIVQQHRDAVGGVDDKGQAAFIGDKPVHVVVPLPIQPLARIGGGRNADIVLMHLVGDDHTVDVRTDGGAEAPEIFPDDAKAGGAAVVSTGRSDFPNQINNVLAFPGIFRGAFDVRASDINEEMKMAAAKALAELISEDELSADYIIPKAFDKRVGPAVAKAVAEAARKSGVARI